MLAVPPPSQPRWGSTAPTFDLQCCRHCVRQCNHDLARKAEPLWELSSFSEAAKAVGQARKMSAVPPSSQPRRGSTAPTFDLGRCRHCTRQCNHDLARKAEPLWELSSFSEAAKAMGQAKKMLAVPPLSQPRRGSTAPTFDLRCCRHCVRQCNHDLARKADPLWELSSFGEAAKAVAQAKKMLAVPPLSQPRRGSTAPTFDLGRCRN